MQLSFLFDVLLLCVLRNTAGSMAPRGSAERSMQMLAMKEKRSLFGGALRCAGLASAAMISNTAVADFDPEPSPIGGVNYAFVYANNNYFAHVYSNTSMNYVGGFPDALSYAGPGGSLDAYAGPTGMGAAVTAVDPLVWGTAAGAIVRQYFSVQSTKEVTLTWDFTQAVSASYGLVYEIGVGGVAYAGAVGTSGSILITLDPGALYTFRCRAAVDSSTQGVSAFVTLTNVPAPGAIALLGLGMIGTRRRRRE